MWTCQHCNGQTDDEFEICWTCKVPRGTSATGLANDRVLVTTTPSLTTHEIIEYVGPVFGETVYGANFFKDVASSFTDIFGGRSDSYESVLVQGRIAAIGEMMQRAEKLDCNAIVGMSVQYAPIGASMFLICVSGTAVRATPKITRTEEN